MRPTTQRGQSLVLMGLCLLLLVLMVMMTLGIATRVREKIELQTITDTAAFSNATLVARAFNEVALSNRAIVGDMVAMAADYSVVSWSSMFEAEVTEAIDALDEAQNGYGSQMATACSPTPAATFAARAPECACASAAYSSGDWARARAALQSELSRLNALPWDALDTAAAAQATDYRMHALTLAQRAQYFLDDQLAFKVSPYQVAKTYAMDAMGGHHLSEIKVPLANDGISLREMYHATGGDKQEFIDVGRGTRYPFVEKRGNAGPINARFGQVLMAAGVSALRIVATSTGKTDWVGDALQAQDQGEVSVSFSGAAGPCSGAVARRTRSASLRTGRGLHLHASARRDANPALHELTRCETQPGCQLPPPSLYDINLLGEGTDEPQTHCQQPPCQRTESVPLLGSSTPRGLAAAMVEQVGCTPCPGVWPPYLGYRKNACQDPRDLYCQPKSYAIVQRDYSERAGADPWNLMLHFQLGSSGGQRLDLKRQQLSDGTNISRQTAVAGGLAYYHYAGGARWREYPNLLNPFWRASLAPMDVDARGKYASGGDDIPNFLLQSIHLSSEASRSAGVLALDAFTELKRQGFEGEQ